MPKIGPHEHILELQKDSELEMLGYTLAHLEVDVDQVSNAIAQARMHGVAIPAHVRSTIAGFRSQLRQAEAACGKPADTKPE